MVHGGFSLVLLVFLSALVLVFALGFFLAFLFVLAGVLAFVLTDVPGRQSVMGFDGEIVEIVGVLLHLQVRVLVHVTERIIDAFVVVGVSVVVVLPVEQDEGR